MRNQLRRGGLKYISFIILDLLCLVLSNVIAVQLYLRYGDLPLNLSEYAVLVGYMLVIDLGVTLVVNTLNRVLRRKFTKELTQSVKHVGISFVMLAGVSSSYIF